MNHVINVNVSRETLDWRGYMRNFLYTINTILIQILGRINLRLFPYHKRYLIMDRLCYSDYEDSGDAGLGLVCHISCCDCGASHYFWKANRGIYGVPVRPQKYTYSIRLKTDSVLADSKAKTRWDTNR